MKAKIENNTLYVEIPLETPHRSASGKTLVIASSRGCKRTDATLEGQSVFIGFNAFVFGTEYGEDNTKVVPRPGRSDRSLHGSDRAKRVF